LTQQPDARRFDAVVSSARHRCLQTRAANASKSDGAGVCAATILLVTGGPAITAVRTITAFNDMTASS
jgi:hypothetical protein